MTTNQILGALWVGSYMLWVMIPLDRRNLRISVGAFALMASIAFAIFWTAPAKCAWCPPAPCLSSTSCGGCACLKEGGASTGVCVSQR